MTPPRICLALTAGLTALLLSGEMASAASQFELRSADLAPGRPIPNAFVFDAFGCHGANVSPALTWTGAPRGTQSFVLTVFDPDAPTGSGFWHWVIYNIPATVTSLPQSAGTPGHEPAGAVQGSSDYGRPGYGGPCPPAGLGPHRYGFTIYAVSSSKLDLSERRTAALVGFATHFVTLGKASFSVTYRR